MHWNRHRIHCTLLDWSMMRRVKSMAGGANVPEVWGRVPLRNKNFTGRGELIERLRAGLLDSARMTAVVPHTLQGWGGVGKTQIAVEYAYRYQSEYELIWWVGADQGVLLRSALAALAPKLGLREASISGIDDAVVDVLDALRRGEPYSNWLLIFDNAEQPEDLIDLIPQGPGHVLITSRNHLWASRVDTVEVNVFDRAESKEFLVKRVRGAIDQVDADRLAEALGDLPLALEQAGALLAERGMPAEQYLTLLAEQGSQLLSHGKPGDYPLPMTAAWSLSVTTLMENLPEAIDLLRCCASFGPEVIPRSIFDQVPKGLSPQLAGLLIDRIRLSRAIAELGRYALAKLDVLARTIQVHRLIQKLVRDELPLEEQERIQHEVHLLLAAFGSDDPDDSKNWDTYLPLLGHLEPVEIAKCMDPEVHAFAIRIIRYLFATGDYSSARRYSEIFLESWAAESGELAPDVLRLRLELANILRELGNYAEARELNSATAESAERLLGPDDELTLWCLRGTGADLRASGDFAAAREHDEISVHRY